MTLLRNPFDPAWGILMTLIQIYWGILLAPDKYPAKFVLSMEERAVYRGSRYIF
jgi:hypothetical protein